MKSTAFTYMGRMILLLFVIANTGFTSVMRTCNMGDMGCCGDSLADMHCAQEGTNDGKSLAIVADDCMSSVTLGGIPDTHAISIKSLKETNHQVATYVPLSFILANTHNNVGTAQLIVEDSSGPPTATPQYLFNLTLLI